MESLLAYDSSSSSEESDESPNKKRKVAEADDNKVCEADNVGKTEDKKLNSSIKPTEACGLFSKNFSESKQITTGKNSIANYRINFSERFLGDTTHSRAVYQTNDNKKSPVFFNSAAQRTLSTLSTLGPNIKPYVSKRQRERLTQTTASTFTTNQQLKETDLGRDGSLKGVNYHSELKTELLSRKATSHVCRPSKQLHLNLEGHSQGVNCVRWNPTESNNNLLLSASMNHMVCVWDTHRGGACTQRLTQHTEAVKDAKRSPCGSEVLSCGYDKTARLSDLETGIGNINSGC